MFSPAFSAFWLLTGYLILLILLGMFTARIARMKGIKTRAGYLGAVFWVIGVLVFFILAQFGSPDVLILFAVSFVVPLFYLVNLMAVFLDKKRTWEDPDYKKKSLEYLLIFALVLLLYVIGIILA